MTADALLSRLTRRDEVMSAEPIRLVETKSQLEDDEIEYEGANEWPKLPDAEYLAKLVTHEVTSMRMFRGALRLFAVFEIVGPGQHSGARIYGAWPVKFRCTSDGRKRIAVGTKSDLYIMLCTLYERRLRPDRITLAPLKQCLLKIRTRTVKNNFRQRQYPECLQYSTVDWITAIEAGTT